MEEEEEEGACLAHHHRMIIIISDEEEEKEVKPYTHRPLPPSLLGCFPFSPSSDAYHTDVVAKKQEEEEAATGNIKLRGKRASKTEQHY